jgi:hypothetical protein
MGLPYTQGLFFSFAVEIIRSRGQIGPNELSRRTGTTPQECYIAVLAWRGICAAMRSEGPLPNDDPRVTKGGANGVDDDGKGDIVSLEQAQNSSAAPINDRPSHQASRTVTLA